MEKKILMELLLAKKYQTVQDLLNVMNAVDIASLLSELDDGQLAASFRLISKDKAADTFANMSSSMQAYLIDIFSEKELKVLLDALYMDDTVTLLEDMPASLVTRILEQVSPENRSIVNTILNYPDDSAGSIMTTEYVDLKENTLVGDALAHIRKVGIRRETIYTCYILKQRKLIGIVSAKELMTSDTDTPIRDIMEKKIISVHAHTDREEVAKLLSKYALLAIPVIDDEGRMVGIVTFDDAMDVLEEEVTEDITKMAAINPSEDSYFETSVFSHARNRILWLLILMLSASVTGSIITRYQDAFSAIPLLVSFIPMLMDTGGNCGSQSSTLIIRGIALDEIRLQDIFKVIFKEFRIALLVSSALALANGLRIWFVYRDVQMAVVVGISLVATIIISKLIGCILPLLARKIHLDPAIMAAPLITTIVDTCSIIIYFTVATHIFHL